MSTENLNKMPFRPVRGTEEAIKKLTAKDGYLYFTTDTKKIYQSINGKLESFGGSSGVFYANKTFTNPQDLSFHLNDFNPKDSLPNVDDLIINTSTKPDRDGFYRVIRVNEETQTVDTNYLAVGGGGGGGSSSGLGDIKITPYTDSYTITTLELGKELSYSVSITDNNNNPIITPGIATWWINGQEVNGGEVSHGKTYKFETRPYLNPNISVNVITLSISANTGGVANKTQTYTWNIKCVDLKLDWNWEYTFDNYIKSNKFRLSNWTPYGGINCKLHISFDGGYVLNESYFIEDISATQTGIPQSTKQQFNSLPYGAHRIDMWLTAVLEDGTEIPPSNKVSNILTFIGENEEDRSHPILTVPFYTTITKQYDTLQIPFMIYDPRSDKAEVKFLVNDAVYGTPQTYDRGQHEWNYSVENAGTFTLGLQSGTIKETFTITATPVNIEGEVIGYDFILKARSFSGNAELQEWANEEMPNGEKRMEFSDNFDWVNGGIQSETDEYGNVRQFIKVRQGTTMTINKDFFSDQDVSLNGKNIKICFKATRCYDYTAPVLSCYNEGSKLGLKLNAQTATFTSTNVTLNSQYCEDSYIELECEIWPKVSGDYADRYVMFWVDGVPAGVKVFGEKELFYHTQGESKMIIGSDLCDVQIYLIKYYNYRLNEDEHLNNFIADAPSASEVIDRHHRNDILEGGIISYKKLVENNPNCHAYLYEVPRMVSGSVEVDDCHYEEYYNDGNTPYLTADGVTIKAQGTSSMAYGVGAFNLRSDFKQGFKDKNGQPISGRSISKDSIPLNYFCTKVNVASCECANNAINAEWYNRHQPYLDGHRRKQRTDGKKARDCMEFDFGVIFVKDTNDQYDASTEENYLNSNVFGDDAKYMSNKYYKQYAIGNMGNDKKNTEVFHDTDPANKHRVCCVEVANNQKEEHMMTKIVDTTVFQDKDPYEFRYPSGNNKASDEMKQAFVDFVNWMASSNPNKATGNILKATEVTINAATYNKYNIYFIQDADGNFIPATGNFDETTTYYTINSAAQTENDTLINVIFQPYTFKGFNPPGYDDSTASGKSLKGFVCSEYAKDQDGRTIIYQYDTKEYRMAKMLRECEDHLVMDSVVFHYLFIQRHTMVDNVAKNTFWSTEDLQHWDLTKNYDNDTSDGNDNSGNLVFGYGVEVFDRTENGKQIFNAPDSVWLNFIYNLPTVQQELYQTLGEQENNPWSAQAYLNLFKEKQSLIPERCWIYDYFRKYIRPRRLGLDQTSFLDRLEGGMKTHQRKQYETYQEFYLNSKYMATSTTQESAALDMRLNSADNVIPSDYVIPIKAYVDLYPSALIGSSGQAWRLRGEKGWPIRVKRGTQFEIPVGRLINQAQDATCYIYHPSMIQEISNLAYLYPTYAPFNRAKKLRHLELGSDDVGYKNPYLKSVSVNTNTMLETIKMQNIGDPTVKQELDLKNLKTLKELRINGSSFTGLTMPESGLIDTAYLNSLSALSMNDLQHLSTVVTDKDFYKNLTQVSIIDCPKISATYYNESEDKTYTVADMAYEIAKTADLNVSYAFKGVNWVITDINDLEMDGNKIVGIKVLNKLIGCPAENGNTVTALTGTITIPVETGYSLNQFDLYNKYNKIYPNLNLQYQSNGGEIINAIYIKFLNDQNGSLYYDVYTNGQLNLALLTSEDGPNGSALGTPSKEETDSHTFTWTNKWIDAATKQAYAVTDFKNITPDKDMIFYPEFNSIDRKYMVTCYDYNGEIIRDYTKECIYDSTVTIPNYWYRDSSDLSGEEQHYRWSFKGWTNAPYPDNVNLEDETYIDTSNLLVKKHISLYAHYIKEDCRLVASNSDYFIVDNDAQGNPTIISLNPEYKYKLKGKITVPSKLNNVFLTTIDNFSNRNQTYGEKIEITDLYFLNDSQYTEIKTYAFADNNSEPSHRISNEYINIYLPASIKTIGDNAFYCLTKLKTVMLHNMVEKIGHAAFEGASSLNTIVDNVESPGGLPAALTSIGTSCFYGAGDIVITALPDGLVSLPTYSLGNCKGININTFGSEANPMESIANEALDKSGNNSVKNMTIYCKNQNSIKADAFLNYDVEVEALTVHSTEGIIGNDIIASWKIQCVDGVINTTCISQHIKK